MVLTHLENIYREVDAQLDGSALQEHTELVIKVRADRHVGEHPMQLTGVLVATRLLQGGRQGGRGD